jgi:hypothetical protein
MFQAPGQATTLQRGRREAQSHISLGFVANNMIRSRCSARDIIATGRATIMPGAGQPDKQGNLIKPNLGEETKK